jgi:hypothetical protein
VKEGGRRDHVKAVRNNLEDKSVPQAKECKWPLEAEKNKKVTFP